MHPDSSLQTSLIVGAGAVGQVCAWHLHRGGSEVGFVVKPKYEPSTREGLTLHHQKVLGRTETHAFDDFDVVSDYDDVEAGHWDSVWLCVSSTALRGEWLDDLLERVPDAVIVSLQPGLGDRDYMLERVDESRLVRGMIPFIAYQAPLPGQDIQEGLAYFLPPLFPFPFAGERAADVAAALDRGGLTSKVSDDVSVDSAMASTVLIPAVGALELANWDMQSFRKSDLIDLASCASREAQDATAAHHDTRVPFTNKMAVRPWLLSCGLRAATPALPFDLEDYLAFHFGKTSDQTRQMLAEWVELGERYEIDTPRLTQLLKRLRVL